MAQILDLCLRHTVRMATDDPLQLPDIHDLTTGLKAYDAFSSDIENAALTIQQDESDTGFSIARAWGCFAVYPQWTSRLATAWFLKQYGSFAEPSCKNHLDQASVYFEKEVKSWLEWEKHLGRNRQILNSGGVEAHNKDFNRRWSDPGTRELGAKAVAEAAELERKAIDELSQYVEKVNPVQSEEKK